MSTKINDDSMSLEIDGRIIATADRDRLVPSEQATRVTRHDPCAVPVRRSAFAERRRLRRG
jgi:hypothetical protein